MGITSCGSLLSGAADGAPRRCFLFADMERPLSSTLPQYRPPAVDPRVVCVELDPPRAGLPPGWFLDSPILGLDEPVVPFVSGNSPDRLSGHLAQLGPQGPQRLCILRQALTITLQNVRMSTEHTRLLMTMANTQRRLVHCIPAFLYLALTASPAATQSLPSVPVPAENPITEEKRILGKILFWEEQLSSDNSTACGSCHIPSVGGTDPRTPSHPGPDQVFGTDDDVIGSRGVRRSDSENERTKDPVFGTASQVTRRAAPSFFGMSAFAPDLFWDGRASSRFVDPETGAVSIGAGGALESQAIAPILSDVEMAKEGRDWDDVRLKLEEAVPLALATNLPADTAAALVVTETYPELFERAFGDSRITAERIAFAIATYERTLIPDQTPWDRFVAGDESALSEQQQIGWENIQEHTVCLNCHPPPQFTDHLFHRVGAEISFQYLG